MKIKRIFSLISLLCFVLSANAQAALPRNIAGASAVKISGGEYSAEDELVLIVELYADALLATDEAAELGTDYIATEAAESKNNSMLASQARLIDNINKAIGEKAELISNYTMLFNGFAIRTSYGNMDKIKAVPGVKSVYISEKRKYTPSLGESVEMMGALPSQMSAEYTGKGQVIAIVDSSFNISHELFAENPPEPKFDLQYIKDKTDSLDLHAEESGRTAGDLYRNTKIPFAYDYADNDTDVKSSVAHGNHVAGIAAGKGDKLKGIAPDSQLVLMKVFNNDSETDDVYILNAMQDAVALGVSVINCSFGTPYESPQHTGLWDEVLPNAKNAGVFVAAAAGNEHRGFNDLPFKSSNKRPISTENIDYSASGMPSGVSSVTAVASFNTAGSSVGAISAFSSYGVSENLELKPEITAPGGSIYSAGCTANNSYLTMSGTSMASPHIAGAAALIGEHIDSFENKITGAARVDLIENLLMSSADIIRQADGTAYTPRVQGAGAADVASALKTHAVLLSDGGRTKLSLSDGIENSFDISFDIKNISGSDISYDSIAIEVLTDNYSVSGGKSYITDSHPLRVISHNLPSSVTVKKGESETISATVSLDEAELGKIAEVFTKGFYIDGFVSLTSADETTLSIPFTGFRGNWTEADIFDSSIYDEGGSLLVSEANGVFGTRLISATDNLGNAIVLGEDGADGYDSEYIAISPNGDGFLDSIILDFAPLRAISKYHLSVIDKNSGRVVADEGEKEQLLDKFVPTQRGLSLAELPDGEYALRLSAYYNYNNPKLSSKEHIIEIPFYADSTNPEISSVDFTDSDTIEIALSDENHLSQLDIECTDNKLYAGTVFQYPQKGAEEKVSFKLSDINAADSAYEDIYLYAYDKAYNEFVSNLSCLLGDIHPSFNLSYDGASLLGSIDISSAKADKSCDIVLALYSEDGALTALHTLADTAVPMGESNIEINFKTDLSKAKKCKLYFWETGSLIPYDTAKTINVADEIRIK